VVSTSFGYSEFVAQDTGIVRDFDSDGVEIVRFQLAHIEYHRGSAMTDDIGDEPMVAGPEPSCSNTECGVVTTEAKASIECVQRSDDDNDDDVDCSKIEVPAAAASAHPPSLNSTKSEESEPNEMQSLMTDGMHTC